MTAELNTRKVRHVANVVRMGVGGHVTSRLDYDTPHEDLYAEYCRLYKENKDLQTTVHNLLESPSEHHVKPYNMLIVLIGFGCLALGMYFQSKRMDNIELDLKRKMYSQAYCQGL